MKPETPPMTAKELREAIPLMTDMDEACAIADDMLVWYSANFHLITIGEDYAFKRTINALMTKCEDLRKQVIA